MAVHTDVHEEELAAFLQNYTLGGLLSYRGIAEGIENSNFMLHTEQGNFILTLYEKRVEKNDLPFFLGLMQHLSQKGLSCPQPVICKDGAMIGECAGRPAAIFTFLEGTWMRKPNAHHCAEVGEALAFLHEVGQDFTITRKNGLDLSAWRPLWEKCRVDCAKIWPNVSAEIDSEIDFLESNWPKNLPSGVIHADLFNDNVFFLNDKLSGIIDFYFACNDYLAYDLAICLNAWCFERDFSYNLTKGQNMLKAYHGKRPLSPEEINTMPILARGAALRFFLTRAYDWFNTPENSLVVKKDPQEYFRKLKFFQNIKMPNEIGL